MKASITTLLAGFLFTGVSFAQNIYTVAGNGCIAFSGDGGPDTAAQLYMPYSTAVDANGNIYIADQGNNRIRMVNTSGTISTIAGTGVAGFYGDKGNATAARLNHPFSVAVDGNGNVYVSDQGNNCIRQINTSGIITTIAGNDTLGYRGDGGPATKAMLNQPAGIACTGTGTIYVADQGNNRIRVISLGTISTVAGRGVAGDTVNNVPALKTLLNKPTGVALDSYGNIYIADQNNNRVRMVNGSGLCSNIAGTGTKGFTGDGGAAGGAELNKPVSVCADAAGNVYIADMGNNRVRTINGGIISTLAGNGIGSYSGDGGLSTAAEVNVPTAVITDASGNLYITDSKNDRIRMVNTSGIITTAVGDGIGGYSGNNGPSGQASVPYPDGVTGDDAGNIYFADQYTNVVRKISRSGMIYTIAGTGTATFSGDGGVATAAGLSNPAGVCLDALGNVYIADAGNNRIRKVDTTTGIITTIAGTGVAGFAGDGAAATAAELNAPYGIVADAAGNIYFTDLYNYRIRKINTSGIISTVAGTGVQGYNGDKMPATAAELSRPEGITLDKSGDIYVADNYQMLIRKINKNDSMFTVAGNRLSGFSGDSGMATKAMLNSPSGVAVDAAGNIYITDQGNNRVRVVNTAGTIYTLAGTGAAGFWGDKGPAIKAKINQPAGIFVDDSSNIFIADHNNNRIREISNKIILGVNKLTANNQKVSVYPNPSNGKFNIKLSEGSGQESVIEVYNILGEKVYSNLFSTLNCQFSIEGVSGIYLYRVISEKGEVIGEGKLIKE